MKHFLFVVLLLRAIPATAQEIALQQPSLREQMLYGTPAHMEADSMVQVPKRRLLPEQLSIVERTMWGESGFLRSTGIASPLTPEVRRSELELRRTMLTAHQIGGFVTLGCMLSAVYCGQKLLDGNSGYRGPHEAFVSATIFSYSGTALLSVLSPPPLIRREETSTITIHKTLAWIHMAGMILTPLLGESIKRDYDRAKFHQASAYVTTAALAASLVVVTF